MKQKYLLVPVLVSLLCGCAAESAQASLPLPEVEEGMRGELGIDRNINEATIDEYLNRSDSVYRDMRMLKDDADYEAIGGDSYLSGYVNGFEIVPYPYLCNVTGLPEAVGESYQGNTLFTVHEDGTYTANYEESMEILEYYFPKDKTIFLMCGGGGYAGMTKNLLVSLGWDETKIYNTGGYWYYQGKNDVRVKREENGEVYYDFYKLPYHDIDCTYLHPANGYVPKSDTPEEEDPEAAVQADSIPNLSSWEELSAKIDAGDSFILYAYLPGCVSCASFQPIAEEFAKADLADMVQMSYALLADVENPLTKKVQFTPSVFIFRGGEILAYLNPAEDDDLPYYKTVKAFSEWVSGYLNTPVIEGDAVNTDEGCTEGCEVTFGD